MSPSSAHARNRPVEDIALERYGSLDEYHEALEEKRIVEEKEQRRRERRGTTGDGRSSPSTAGFRTPDAGAARRYVFNSEDSFSRPGSRASFRRPGEAEGVQTPVARVEELRRREGITPRVGAPTLAAQVSTPIPSVFTPPSLARAGSGFPFPKDTDSTSKPPLTTEELNKMQAKVLRAKLMDDPNAAALEEEYEYERHRAHEGGDQGGEGMWEGSGEGRQGQMGRTVDEKGREVEVQMLPTLDGRGNLYDVGTGKEDETAPRPGNRRKKQEKVSDCGTSTLSNGSRSSGVRDMADDSSRPVTDRAISFDIMPTTTNSLWAS